MIFRVLLPTLPRPSSNSRSSTSGSTHPINHGHCLHAVTCSCILLQNLWAKNRAQKDQHQKLPHEGGVLPRVCAKRNVSGLTTDTTASGPRGHRQRISARIDHRSGARQTNKGLRPVVRHRSCSRRPAGCLPASASGLVTAPHRHAMRTLSGLWRRCFHVCFHFVLRLLVACLLPCTSREPCVRNVAKAQRALPRNASPCRMEAGSQCIQQPDIRKCVPATCPSLKSQKHDSTISRA